MRRILILILCLMVLATSVSAAGISSCVSDTVVAENGTCEVTLTLTLEMESAVSGLVFPLPECARNITVNGTSARSSHAGTVRNVDLSKHIAGAGTYTLVLRYDLPDTVVADEKGNLSLILPLLSGFAYPVENMRFTVTLPAEVAARPAFTSTYYQEAAETVMTVSRQGAVISGTVNDRLQDHESLTMTLAVTEEEFPQSMAKRWSLDTVDLIMMGFALLAILYWLIAMGIKPPQKLRRAMPPEGITAGQIGCRLTGSGVDLTLMVLSWAQMGYILIQHDDNGRVLLHKRMDMGNERSDMENRFFRSLFGRRRMVDATGYHYARLCGKASQNMHGIREIYRRSSGNPLVFRILAALIGTFAGVSMATAFVRDTGWQIVLGILLGLLTTVASWIIQSATRSPYRRDKLPVYMALAAAALWLVISLPAGEWYVAVIVIASQLIAGLAAAYGGRRTDTGRQDMAELLGLRRYLKRAKPEELRRILSANPDYYYALAPYALALGVDKAFARQMGSAHLPQCTYLTTGMDGHMTAREWNQLLRDTVDAMDALKNRMPIDKLLGKQ